MRIKVNQSSQATEQLFQRKTNGLQKYLNTNYKYKVTRGTITVSML